MAKATVEPATVEPQEDLRSVVAELRAELASLKARTPRFVRKAPHVQPRVREYVPPEEKANRAKKSLALGQEAQGTGWWYDTPRGRDSLPPEYRPLFNPGDIVRLDPDAVIWGTVTEAEPEGRKWGDFLEAKRLEGVGEVLGCMSITGTYEPKYKVAIPGIGRPDGRGSGFRESELLPYD